MPRKAQIPHLRIRIEPRLLARLEKSREKNSRTLTGEIVERLEASFRKEDREAELEAVAKRGATDALHSFLKLSLGQRRPAQAPGTEPAAAPIGAEELRIIADLVRRYKASELEPESESRHNAGTEPDPEKVVDATLMQKLRAAVEERERVEARIKSLQSAQEPLKREGEK
jgi:hypothetical protein